MFDQALGLFSGKSYIVVDANVYNFDYGFGSPSMISLQVLISKLLLEQTLTRCAMMRVSSNEQHWLSFTLNKHSVNNMMSVYANSIMILHSVNIKTT